MADRLLSALIEGSIDTVSLINGLESGTFIDQHGEFTDLEDKKFLQEFVPCFLSFVKDKLSRNLANDQILSFSPKRRHVSRDEKRSGRNNSYNNQQSRSDGQGSASRPENSKVRSAKGFMSRMKKHSIRSFSEKDMGSNAYHKPSNCNLNSSNEYSNFSDLSSSFEDHGIGILPQTSTPQASTPHSSTSQASTLHAPILQTSTPQASKQYSKRRITPTLVTAEKGIFHQKGETQKLFETSLVLETSGSSQDSSKSPSGLFPFDRKSTSIDKSKRGKKRNEIPLSAFLGNREKIKENGTEAVIRKRAGINNDDDGFSNESCDVVNGREKVDDLSVKENLKVKVNDAEMIEAEDLNFQKRIADMQQMRAFIKIYSCAMMENLISNIFVELYFLHSVFNCAFNQQSMGEVDEVILDSVESCVYFAAKVLEETKHLSDVFDMATLSLISQNKRLQLLAPVLVEFVNNRLNDLSLQHSQSVTQLSFSGSLGVPFQVEGNNRKLFSSDRYFYSFSKMRDKFYGLLRRWEESHLKHDWSIESELGERFQGFFFEFQEFPVYSQFSQLFIAQLIEVSSQDFCTILNRDEHSQSSGLLEYLKSKNPSKFQRLQERFFSPMISQGPCPKPVFSDVEIFFKLFIDRSCNFHFLIHLRDNLISRIMAINSIDFASQIGSREGADDNEALYRTRNEYSLRVTEARILAKFLGYIIFSPYETEDQSKHEGQNVYGSDVMMQPFDPNATLVESVCKGKLLVTIPWLVQYLSYMNQSSLRLKLNSNVLLLLSNIYRAQGLRFKDTNLNGMLILFQIGWLFEQPLISSYAPFYQLLETSSKCWNRQLCDWRSSNGTDFISKSLLIRFCPYISEIKNVLSKAGSGSFRKIKPLTNIQTVPMLDSGKILRENMIQDFFKYKPKYFKETAEFVVERFCGNLKLSINRNLAPAVLKDATEGLKKSVIIEEGVCQEIENLKLQHSALLKRTLSISRRDLDAKIRSFCDEYCNENSEDVIGKMLPNDVDERVVQTTAKIVANTVKHKMKEWISYQINDQHECDLNAAFHKLLMAEVKRCNKSLDLSKS